jgi:hypothetical protein
VTTNDKEGYRQRTGSEFRRGVYWTTYYFGFAVRKAVDLVLIPYDMIAKGFSRVRSAEQSGRSATARDKPKEVHSRLSSLNNRLQSIEQMLSGRERRDNISYRESRGPDRLARRENGRQLPDDLLESLSDPDPTAREVALGTVSELSGEEAAAVILEALHDADPNIRRAAAAAAARNGATNAGFSLILLLNDLQPEVRQEAKAALESITGRRMDFDSSADASIRAKKVEELQNWWKEERFAKLSGELRILVRPEKSG